jgi:Brp/Blh family beta-carotene 15,15'-monooxygenase
MLHVLIFQIIAKPVWDRRGLWGLYLTTWIISWFFPADLIPIQSLLILFALAAFVIPHQAADFFLPAWILNPPWLKRINYWVSVIGLTLALGMITFGIWSLSVNFSIALFAALIMWHWGSLDTVSLYPYRGPSWLVASMGRGMLVLIAPLYFKPLETQELFLNFLGTDQSAILTTLYSFSGYLLILAIVLEILAAMVHKFVRGHGLPDNLFGHLAESLLLILTFALIDPLYGIVFYFLILHSFRHMYRTPVYIPEARGLLLEGDGILKCLSYHFQRTNFVSLILILVTASWFSWQIFTGSTMTQATAACIRPLALLLIPHSLVSLLADFNPKKLEG